MPTADRITPAGLTVTANDTSRLFTEPNPPLDGVLAGVVPGDDITATYSTTAVPGSPVGTYPITPTLVDPDGGGKSDSKSGGKSGVGGPGQGPEQPFLRDAAAALDRAIDPSLWDETGMRPVKPNGAKVFTHERTAVRELEALLAPDDPPKHGSRKSGSAKSGKGKSGSSRSDSDSKSASRKSRKSD